MNYEFIYKKQYKSIYKFYCFSIIIYKFILRVAMPKNTNKELSIICSLKQTFNRCIENVEKVVRLIRL